MIGLGFVKSVGALKEYEYSKSPTGDMMTSFLWERNIAHSIRANRENGFIFPFDEIKKYINANPLQNIDELIVVAPNDYRDEFSYATEHLSHDALILTFNKTISVLKKYNEIGLPYGQGSSWDDCIKWCQIQLENAWKDRGAYPGLGAVLSALGVPYGFDVAKAIKAKYNDNELWENISKSIENLSAILPINQKGIIKRFTKTKRENLAELLDEKQSYLRLLSRIALTLPQAKLLLDAARSDRWLCNYADQLTNIHYSDLSIAVIDNPYILFEKTYRLEEKYRIGIGKIDLALFPPEFVAEQFFYECDSTRITEQDDKRRLRAIIVFVLEQEASKGSSLMLACDLIALVGKFRSDVPDIEPEVRLATLQSKRRKDFFEEYFVQFPIELIPDSGDKRTETALQLIRLQEIGSKISDFVNSRIEHSFSVNDNWDSLINGVLKKEQQSEQGREQESRREKAIAIAKMACSKISVLTGGAGTGKTTTLAALCKNHAIQSEGILVLAPTGKALVVLSSKLRDEGVRATAKTLFQFLRSSKHCDTKTWSYYLSGKVDNATPGTVIIDECSMLSEEMFAALIEAVGNAKRVIFVGDHNQLPPIGTGKPFYDLVQKLKEQDAQPHYANLLVSNRQKQGGTTDIRRLDVELSKLFSEDLVSHVQEDIFAQISVDNTNIEFIPCKEAAMLPAAIEQALAKIGITDVPSFDASLGGELDLTGEWMNFNSASSVDNWQILSPYRNKEVIGTSGINAFVQSAYRIPKPKNHRNTPDPLGADGIRFAEKVINVQNQDRTSRKWNGSIWSPKKLPMDSCERYTANGEIGLITGLKKNIHFVQFATQDGYIYNYYSGASEDSPLELAYALTVHKAQGSGFKSTILVLIEPDRGINPLVTREMLYTALTRQSEKVFIIYNKEPSEIRKYSGVELSDLAHRKTNLFGNTVLRQVKDGWYDSKHIFITEDGTKVLSKSEVIVYNMMLKSGLKPIYERELRLGDIVVHPDFTIETPTGDVFWEHLGMLGDYGYRKAWERKEKLYSEHGISIENGKLILSQDELNGSIDSTKIKSQIQTIME